MPHFNITSKNLKPGEFFNLIKKDPNTYLKLYEEAKFCEIVNHAGFDCEEYRDVVTTTDYPNYKITLHRIRSKNI